jgi:hypothetical protein
VAGEITLEQGDDSQVGTAGFLPGPFGRSLAKNRHCTNNPPSAPERGVFGVNTWFRQLCPPFPFYNLIQKGKPPELERPFCIFNANEDLVV